MPKPFDLFLVALSLSFLPYLVAESSSPAPSSQSPSSSSSCPPSDETHHFRLIQPRNGTLYEDFNQIKSTLLVDTTEITSPIEISLYRHVKCNECGYGISPELQHVGTLVHEELDGWLSYEWGTLGIGTYTMHVYLSSTSTTSSKPDVSQYRQCLSQITSTFVIVNNQTLFEPDDNRDDIQVYRWRLLKRWMWENGATHLHQLDIHIDPETGYRSIRTTQEIPANTTILTIPLRTVIQPVTFIHDTPFLRDVTTLLEYSRYDLYNMTDEQHTPAMVLFQIWCLAVGEECWWIHYIRSFPHHSFYMDSINTYRTTKSLPVLTYQDYRQHAPPLPITWSDPEVDAWKEFSGYQTIVNVRNAQRAIIYNSTKYLTAPVITLLNLPRYNDTSTVYHPFTETLLMWSVVMRLSRAWNQQFYITPDYQWIPYNFTRGVKKDDQPTGAHMYPIMDLFDHDDIRGRPVLQDHSIQYLALYTPSAKQLSSGYKKGDVVYDSYKQEMAPITALLHYGWVLPETSHFLHLTLQSVAPENNGTTFTPADYARAASVETVLRYLNIPMHHPWQLGLSLQSLPHRLMLRARLLFYQFERDPENPISAEQLAHLLKQREYMILSPSTERLAHNFLRHAIWDNIRLPERENDTSTTDTIPAVASVSVDVTDEEKQKLIESSTTTSNEESVTTSIESSNTTSTKVPLTPDSILESIFTNRNSTYHEYARASFILAERHVARHILKLIDQHEKMSQSMEFTPLNHVAPSTTNFTTCPPPKSRRTYRLRSRA